MENFRRPKLVGCGVEERGKKSPKSFLRKPRSGIHRKGQRKKRTIRFGARSRSPKDGSQKRLAELRARAPRSITSSRCEYRNGSAATIPVAPLVVFSVPQSEEGGLRTGHGERELLEAIDALARGRCVSKGGFGPKGVCRHSLFCQDRRSNEEVILHLPCLDAHHHQVTSVCSNQHCTIRCCGPWARQACRSEGCRDVHSQLCSLVDGGAEPTPPSPVRHLPEPRHSCPSIWRSRGQHLLHEHTLAQSPLRWHCSGATCPTEGHARLKQAWSLEHQRVECF